MKSTPIHIVRETLHQLARVRRVRRGGPRVLVAAAALLLIAAAVAGAASFAALTWNNAAGGTASTAANWTPNQVPTSADDLTFNIANTYGVTFNSSTTASRTHTYRAGTVSVTASSPHTVSNGITVGSLSGDVATTTHASGLITSNAAVIVGNASGATGTLTVNGGTTDLVLATTAGDLTVGNNGAGTLNVTNFGLVQVADRFQSGSGSTGTANLTVSGGNSLPLLRSTFDVDGTTLASSLGGAGDATMNVSNGGLASFAGSLNVAQGAASSSSLTIGGLDVFQATVTVGADLGIARNSAASSAGGFGVVTVNDEGVLDVGGTMNIGNDPDGGTGFLVLNAGGDITTGSLAVGAAGELDLNGGTLGIDGGTFTYTNPTISFLVGGPANPTVRLLNGADATLQSGALGRAATVGGGIGTNPGLLEVLSGSSLVATSGDIILGETGAQGRLEVGNDGSAITMAAGEEIVVGLNGNGFLGVRALSNATLGEVSVAKNTGSQGTVIVETFATMSATNAYVGGSATANGGEGTLWVNASGAMTVDGFLRIRPSGDLIVSNATLTAGSITAEAGSEVTIDNGVVNAGVFSVQADVDASGDIDAFVVIAIPSARIAANGDLTMGGGGFSNSGVLDCGPHTVTILDNSISDINTVRLNGGRLVVPDGARVSPTDSLYGTGAVDSDVENNGRIVSTGTGLTFEGIVSGDGQGFSGPVVNFANGGGFTGDGQIEVSINADPTSIFTLTGGLVLGDNPVGNEIAIDGAINVGAHTLNILDVDDAELGGVTTLDGGVIFTTDMLLRGNGAIEGRGTVNTNFVGQSDTRITPTGPLSIGNSTAIEGFKTAGRIEVGTHTLTIQTDDQARLGRSTTLAGGTLAHTGNGYFVIETGDTISGFGTVFGGVEQGPGSVIRAEGALTIAPASNFASPILADGGLLQVDTSTVTLLGTNGATLSPTTTISGGTLAAEATIFVPGGGVLRGAGAVTAPLVNSGTIEVGIPTGILTVTNDFDNDASGTIVIDVRDAGLHDRFLVTERLDLTALGGGTLRIRALPGLVVSMTDTISIIAGAPLVGQFDNIEFDPPVLDNLFDIFYTPTQVFLIARAATGVDLPPAGDPSDGAPSDDGVTGGVLPDAFGLRLASRNPFTADLGVAFEFDVPRGGAPVPVAIAVFDASGRRVADLVSGARAAGTHAERWTSADLRALPSGVYFLRMDAGGFGATKKLVMTR
ncbi:MAG: hypothetical protein ACKVU1_15840 [bacterium]